MQLVIAHTTFTNIQKEVNKLLPEHGFKILKSYYTEVNDLTFLDASLEEYMNLKSYWKMLKITIKKPTTTKILKAVAYPIVKFVPSLRVIIVVLAEKEKGSQHKRVERWG